MLLLTLKPDPQASAHTSLLAILHYRVNTLNIVLSTMLSTVLSTKQMLQLAAGCPGASGACARDNPASRGAPDCSHGKSIWVPHLGETDVCLEPVTSYHELGRFAESLPSWCSEILEMSDTPVLL